MEKIKELLSKIGASKELATALVEEIDKHSQDLKVKFEKDLQEKISKVKQICIEEVNREKVNLARKVGVFLESKAKSIEQAMTKQRVVEESESTAVLKKAKALLEGIDIENGGNSRELLALQKKADRLDKAIVTFKEERDRAVAKANKANAIAVKVLQRNSILEEKAKGTTPVVEEKGAEKGSKVCKECGGPMAEGECLKCKGKGKDTKDAGKPKADAKPFGESRERLDASRKVGETPKSTRRTLVESDVAATPGRKADGSPDISKIASDMPE